VLGIGWSLLTLPTFLNEFPVNQYAARIIRGGSFPSAKLDEELHQFDQGVHLTACSPAAVSAAVMSSSILQERFNAESSALDEQIETTRNSLLAAISCLPSDGYLWFALFQIESLRSGLSDKYVSYLAMSYKVDPNEAWLAIPRNRAAFAIFPSLNEDLKTAVLDEFVLLVRTELYREAIDIFLGAARPYQDLVVKQMSKAQPQNRQRFALLLARMGIDAHIPGTSVVVRSTPR
jgi:hypothetical protein